MPLRSGHVQTLLSSRALSIGVDTDANPLIGAPRCVLTSRDGAVLEAFVHRAHSQAAQVILIHGWLGEVSSPYIFRIADGLLQSGYNVSALHLRDHGDSHRLNKDLFHSARLDEVVDACNQLAADVTQPTYIVGFSLGGNFALRLGSRSDLDARIRTCIAICPAISPRAAADQIDGGLFVYRYYFVRKWIKALLDKAAAFPAEYNFEEVRAMNTVGALTDHFVAHHTPFESADHYYAAYAVTPELLQQTTRTKVILAAADDPVIPIGDLRALRGTPSLLFEESAYGGHCAFLENLGGQSVLSRWVPEVLAANP